MKHCILIIDGAAGWPVDELDGRTTLDAAHTPNLDWMAQHGFVGMAQTVPRDMEPSSACACMSILGYSPRHYYTGRGPIEAVSMDIELQPGEAAFRCNLVHVADGKIVDYSSGHISSEESRPLLEAVAAELSSPQVRFYPGVSYRHICVIRDVPEVLEARCVPPHNVPGQPLAKNLPSGPGSAFLRDLMERSRPILENHPINQARRARSERTANMIWLFWGGATAPDMPTFEETFGLTGAISSGVDLLRGLGKLAGMDILEIAGVTDGPDNDYRGQAAACLEALDDHDLVIVHVESPDEEGHSANVPGKIEAIERIDADMVRQLRDYAGDLRVLVMPDHPTPIAKRTHVHDPVPFLLFGPGIPLRPAGAYAERDGAALSPVTWWADGLVRALATADVDRLIVALRGG